MYLHVPPWGWYAKRKQVRKTLANMKTVTPRTFQHATGIDTSGWLKKCPADRCDGELRVSLLREEEQLYGLFCGKCGWTPEDGFAPKQYYLTLKDVEDITGIAYRRLAMLAQQGVIDVVNFGHARRADYRMVPHFAYELKAAGPDPEWATLFR